MPEPYIHIKGARVNNLKNIELKIPRNCFAVITGVSGSGKSSLAFDTLFAEGQRRYVESLSAYARQFLGRIRKPDVDFITGIPPAIAIEQKVNARNPRSTLGTVTELYDYLRLLYARIGKTFSPLSGREVRHDRPEDVSDYIFSLPKDSYAYIMAPFGWEQAGRRTEKLMELQQQGYTRFFDGKEMLKVETLLQNREAYASKPVLLLLDRIPVCDTPDNRARALDSIANAFSMGEGRLFVNDRSFSTRFEADGIRFEEPDEYLFSFNSPLGACPRCGGYGNIVGIDESLVIPDPQLSVYEDAVACWKGEVMRQYKLRFIQKAVPLGFPIHTPYCLLSPAQKALLWNEEKAFTGIRAFFRQLEKEKYKIQCRVMISRYTGKTLCPVCKGSRLRPEALYVKTGGKSIDQLLDLSLADLAAFFESLQLSPRDAKVSCRLLAEIKTRLAYLNKLGLGYLSLNRKSNTLSGGESQRVNLAHALGSSLVGSLYILDEPSIGLHPRDTQKLIETLRDLRDLGNTVIVVEHDEDIMRAADRIIDIGPLAGSHGGEISYQGPAPELHAPIDCGQSRTLEFLTHPHSIPIPTRRRRWNSYIDLNGVSENNLQHIDVRFPLQALVAVTGVSGSGKSSLVSDVLYPALYRELNQFGGKKAGKFVSIGGDTGRLSNVEMIDQNPIGKSSRSNPVTYIKAYDDIRRLFSMQTYARMNGFGHSHFSFNIDGGRCPDCLGEGFIKVEMQFMADVILPCESCGGKRFRSEILEVKYRGRNIYDVLEMTVEEAVDFFGSDADPLALKIAERLQPLMEVGLSYIKLGQNSATLSGGESQRVKLASFLGKDSAREARMFIFDEPTTGLHYYDIAKLLHSFEALISRGHSIVVVEHNMDVVKCADWVLDLGPDAGDRGGRLCFAGTPEKLILEDSPTGLALRRKMTAK